MSIGLLVGQLLSAKPLPQKKSRNRIIPGSLAEQILLISRDGKKRSARSIMDEHNTTMSSAHAAINKLLELGFWEEVGEEPAGACSRRKLYSLKEQYRNCNFEY